MLRYWDLIRELLIAIEEDHVPRGTARTEEAVEEHLHDLVDMEWVRLHPSLTIEKGTFMLNGEPIKPYVQQRVLHRDLVKSMSLRPIAKDFLDMVRHEDVWKEVLKRIEWCNGLPREDVLAFAKEYHSGFAAKQIQKKKWEHHEGGF